MMKLYEQIDFTSKKILELKPPTELESNFSPKQNMLQKHVRTSSVQFLQEIAAGMPSLPNEDQYKKLQEEHRKVVEAKIEQERQEARVAAAKVKKMKMKLSETQSRVGGGRRVQYRF